MIEGEEQHYKKLKLNKINDEGEFNNIDVDNRYKELDNIFF